MKIWKWKRVWRNLDFMLWVKGVKPKIIINERSSLKTLLEVIHQWGKQTHLLRRKENRFTNISKARDLQRSDITPQQERLLPWAGSAPLGTAITLSRGVSYKRFWTLKGCLGVHESGHLSSLLWWFHVVLTIDQSLSFKTALLAQLFWLMSLSVCRRYQTHCYSLQQKAYLSSCLSACPHDSTNHSSLKNRIRVLTMNFSVRPVSSNIHCQVLFERSSAVYYYCRLFIP